MSDKLSDNVKQVGADTDELVAAFYEAIERMQVGNPRFTKKERQIWSKFLNAAIADVSVMFWMLQSQNNLRLSGKEILRIAKKSHKLSENTKARMIEIMRHVRELILDGRSNDAIQLLTKIITYFDNEPTIEDDC